MRPLVPYADGEFERLHAAGAMTLTASQVPALFGCSRWSGRFALAAHLSGQHPLPEPDHDRIELGREFEGVALRMLARARKARVEQVRGYWRHRELAFLASPDGLAEVPADADHQVPAYAGPVEVKVVTPKKFKTDWGEHPPLAVGLQHQAQLLLGDAERGAIVALVIGDHEFRLVYYPTLAHPGAHARILANAATFLRGLGNGVWPEPDEEPNEAEAAALAAVLRPEAGTTVALDEPEAAARFERWRQASADRLAAEKAEEACKRWFLARMGTAERALIGNARELARKVSPTKGRPATPPGVMTRWNFVEHDDDTPTAAQEAA